MASRSDHDLQVPLILGMTRTEMAERFRVGTQRIVAEHLSAGLPVYGSFETTGVYAILPQDSTAPSPHEPGSTVPEPRAS